MLCSRYLSSSFQSLFIVALPSREHLHLDDPRHQHQRRKRDNQQSQLPAVHKAYDDPGTYSGNGLTECRQTDTCRLKQKRLVIYF